MPTSSNSSRGSTKTSRVFILACATLAIFFNIGSVVIGVYCFARMHSASDSQAQGIKASEQNVGTIACVRCEDGQWKWLFDKLTRSVVNEAEQRCCAESSEQMSVLMELTLRKPVSNPTEPANPENTAWEDNYNFSKASAHKRLLPPEMFNSSIYETPFFNETMVSLKLNDTYHVELKEHVREVKVLDSGFEVIHPGLYHVYSSVHFKPDSSQNCGSFRYKIWEQKVQKVSGGTESLLLKSVHTCCNHCTRDRETSYTGGAFYLDKGDKLRVLISGLGLVSFRTESSYFGLVMLGE